MAPPAGKRFLEVQDLHAWYGESHVLHGVDFTCNEGEVVTLLGRNGAGRTTHPARHHGPDRRAQGLDQGATAPRRSALPTHRIAHLGIGYCPEERGIFSSLSAEENLLLPPRLGATAACASSEIYAMFPNLKERRRSQGTRLSGGEQQMLAVARILRTGARAAAARRDLRRPGAGDRADARPRMITTLRGKGYTIVMVEQNFRFAAPLADRFYVMEHGQVVEKFTQAELRRLERAARYLGV